MNPLSDYYNQVEQQIKERQRRDAVTNTLMDRAKMKMKDRKIDQFKGKLHQMMKLKSFVNVERRLSQINVINDPLSADVLFKRKERKTTIQSGQPLLNLNPELQLRLVEWIEVPEINKREIHAPKSSTRRVQQNDIVEQLGTYSNTYSSLIKTKQPQTERHSTRLMRKSSAIELDHAFDNYFDQFKYQTDQLIKQATLEAKRRYLDFADQKVRICRRQSVSPSRSQSPKKTHRIILDPPPNAITQMKTQMSGIRQMCTDSPELYKNNKYILNRMRSEIHNMHERYTSRMPI